jgi:prepilin-type N-terminal cleavage/methylation domain-containing protein
MIALKRASKGVTLVELIMVTAILSVLASVAYPAFADLRQAGAARSARSELTVAISQARSTARPNSSAG